MAVVGEIIFRYPLAIIDNITDANWILPCTGYITAFQVFFNGFFKKGEFMEYVTKVTSRYPTGENNVSTSEGRKVAIIVKIDVKKLYARMKELGIKSKKIGFQ